MKWFSKEAAPLVPVACDTCHHYFEPHRDWRWAGRFPRTCRGCAAEEVKLLERQGAVAGWARINWMKLEAQMLEETKEQRAKEQQDAQDRMAAMARAMAPAQGFGLGQQMRGSAQQFYMGKGPWG